MKAGAFLVFLGRRALFMAQDGICPICGETLPQRDDYRLCTVDHVWPKSMVSARDKTRGNTLLAHKACNAGKANRRPTGCERLFLFATNRRLGLPELLTASWDGACEPETHGWRTWSKAA
jgi:hypothetical protein